VHCYNYWRDKSELALVGDLPPANMTMDTAKRVLEQCVKNELFDVVLTGGEPFLNFPIVKWLAEEFIKNKIKVSINSNLSLITDKQADWLVASGVRGVLTSVLGPNAEVHDAITTAHGSFDATMRGIRKLIERGFFPPVNCVVTKKNITYTERTFKMLAKLGVKFIAFTPAICPSYCNDFSALAIQREELVKCFNTALHLSKELNVVVDALSSLPLCSLEGVENILHFSKRHCGIGRTQIVCTSEGLTRACPNFDRIEGDLKLENLSEIWVSYKKWNEEENVPKICRNCNLLGLCTGGCRMAAKTANGDYCSPDSRVNSDSIAQVEKQIREQMVSKHIEITGSFLIKDYRLRNEDFGAVIGSGFDYNSVSFISKEAVDVLSHFKIGRIYHTQEVMLKFSQKDKEAFFRSMVNHGVVQFV
jgi:radical SAM protein with 4Fe4S-binding SPASM domain